MVFKLVSQGKHQSGRLLTKHATLFDQRMLQLPALAVGLAVLAMFRSVQCRKWALKAPPTTDIGGGFEGHDG